MDVEQTWSCSDVTEGTDEDKDEDEDRDEEKNEVKDRAAGCIVGQPRATEKRAKPSRAQEQLEHLDPHPGPSIGGEAPPIDRSADSCDGSLTNDVARLLPSRTASPLRKQNGVDSLAPPPICTSPSSFVSVHPPPSAQRSSCKRQNCSHHHHHHHHQKVLYSGKNNPSARTDAVHIQEVAGDDCCVHFVLACLFCEVLSMCAVLGNCLACGVGGAACCDWAVGCCDWAELAGEAGCSEDACQAGLDCGLMGDCCASSDCLEICLECCSICFPS